MSAQKYFGVRQVDYRLPRSGENGAFRLKYKKEEKMAGNSLKNTFTAAQGKEHIGKIQKIIEKAKDENKAEFFTAVTPEEIKNKLKRVHSPMIVFQSWVSTSPGGILSYNFGIYNPDPVTEIWMFAHVFVGSGNVDLVTGTFLLHVDARFPNLTLPAPTGLTLAPGATATLNFAFKVPVSVEKTNYIGNGCLMQVNWHDIGTYLDRGVFVFNVILTNQ